MKYYFLTNATDKKIIGNKFPQCKGVPDGYTFKWLDSPNSMTKLNNDSFPEEDPELLFELDNGAKLTDVISPTNIKARGLLVNEKVKAMLEDYKISTHRFYPATLIVKEKKYNYYWLHLIKEDLSVIDFESSSFYLGTLMGIKLKSLIIQSLDEFNNTFENRENKFQPILAEKIKLKDEFAASNTDLFFFPWIHSDLFISEKLYKDLTIQKISGIQIKEQNIL